MAAEEPNKIKQAKEHLELALAAYKVKKPDSPLEFLTVAKAFEVLFKYTWKDLKYRVESDGLFANSPKEAIRQAAKLGIIENAESWIDCANARNDSVHDYFGIPEKRYLALVEQFLGLIKGKFA